MINNKDILKNEPFLIKNYFVNKNSKIAKGGFGKTYLAYDILNHI